MTLERAKNLATIVSAVAIPVVLAIAGYFVQRELSNEGLRKDYVSIAAGILKEDASRQEPELRGWAVKVLDDNSPIPFSSKARAGLISGAPVVLPGPAWLGPPEKCREAPGKRTVADAFKRLADEAPGLDGPELINHMQAFIDVVTKEEGIALEAIANVKCLQRWVNREEDGDIEYRKAIGAPSSKSVYEQYAKERAASAAIASASAVGPSNATAQPRHK